MSEPIKVRASSWGRLFDCSHAWEWTNLLGNRSPSSPRAQLGTAIHAGAAAFDNGAMTGAPISIDAAADVLVDALLNPTDEVDWRAGDLKLKDAERIGLNLVSKYCSEVSPTYQFVAVEMATFPLVIDCGDGVAIELTGTLDRSRAWENNGKGLSDLKTGKAAVTQGKAKTKGFVAQLATYEILYEYTTGEKITRPSEIIGLKTSAAPEIAVARISDAKRILIGTDTQPGLIEFAKTYFKTGLFPPNPSSYLCSEKYCARWESCIYHE